MCLRSTTMGRPSCARHYNPVGRGRQARVLPLPAVEVRWTTWSLPWLLALGVLAAGTPAGAMGEVDPGKTARPASGARATRGAVEARLRAYEPTSPADWRALGAGVDGVLV